MLVVGLAPSLNFGGNVIHERKVTIYPNGGGEELKIFTFENGCRIYSNITYSRWENLNLKIFGVGTLVPLTTITNIETGK